MEVKITRLSETSVLPSRGSVCAAGYDLCADIEEPITLGKHETVLIGTGLAIAIPDGYFGGVYARSGLSLKEGLRPGNCTGVIDSDYRGEIKVSLHNDSSFERTVTPGERIAQLVIQPYLACEFKEVDSLDETERGTGGFGSTGK